MLQEQQGTTEVSCISFGWVRKLSVWQEKGHMSIAGKTEHVKSSLKINFFFFLSTLSHTLNLIVIL